MQSGWTRKILEDFGFEFEVVYAEEIAEGDLVETPPPFSMGAWGGLIGGLVLAAVAFFPLTGNPSSFRIIFSSATV